jgi:hypothetical protein
MKKPRHIYTDSGVGIVPTYKKGEIVLAKISVEDIAEASKYMWCCDSRGYPKTSTNKKERVIHSYLHRLIMKPKPSEQVDHINGDRLDNRRENLRIATNQQNQMARHKSISKSGYKGVHKNGNRWRAIIKKDGKTIHLGYYDTPEEASMAYDKMAKDIFGEFAVTNGVLYE